ncbi:MAG: hypothetical protein UV92_C0011G0011 [Parcubacteria group bacterium GW2011_GWA1_43_27]|nr:MAG: hypothetical protein UV92_C0011G0011 [Parcubacteria group bacterium GW2011_GWA1_43_27]KKT22274.1 MAG: hypothetical protein UW06_C0014G0010 [Parcubacteria group bacterium GW2011_GWE1_43_8]
MIAGKYKTLFFDWDKALSYSRFWERLEDPQNPHNREGEVISHFLFHENRDLLAPWMRGELYTHDILTQISEQTGIDYNFIRKELEHSCRNMRFVSDEITHLIRKVRNTGVRCVIATDNMDTFREFTIPHMKLDYLFDDFLISCELGVLKFEADKEHRRIPFFDAYLKENNLNYSDVVLFDDCVDDGFYHDIGFQIVQVTKPHDLITHLRYFLSIIFPSEDHP